MRLDRLAATVAVALFLSSGACASVSTTHAADNMDPAPGPVGERPYEMAGRTVDHPPLFSFDDVTSWTVEGRDAEGWLYRSRDRRLFGEHSGKLVYAGTSDTAELIIRPPKPIPIPDPWGSINFWTWGNNWGWAPDPSTPAVSVALLLRDAEGREPEVFLGAMDHQYWFMMQGVLVQRGKAPFTFTGIRIANAKNSERRTIYFGPCSFYQEQLKPFRFAHWPEKLPFPTRPETILPMNRTADFTNTVTRNGDTTVFAYKGSDCMLEYRYRPTSGTLGDIELFHDDKTIRPCEGGGFGLFGTGGQLEIDDPRVERVLLGSSLKDNVLASRWRLRGGEVGTDIEYWLRIRQKSLIVDMEASEPTVTHVGLGRAEGVSNPQRFWIPYLNYNAWEADTGYPLILFADGLFFFTQFDWYVSNASLLSSVSRTASPPNAYNGAAIYAGRTDGQRNCVRERLFINVSPDVDEVLPTIANPKSPMRAEQADRVWRVRFGADYAAETSDALRLRNLGCEKVSIRYHEETWRDAGESFTFRVNAAPAKGGDEALRRFVRSIQALGWRVGLYTNYTDFAPVNSHWSEDHVTRSTDGTWKRAWMRCYAPKPMYSVEMEAKLAPQIHEKFGTNHSYCDVHTAVTPFERVDYDARVPGAGTFRRTFECFGRILYNEKFAHHGPVYSEGIHHWWYAGLTDGNYAQIGGPEPCNAPLIPDFDLLKIHPLEMDAGMGAPDMFFRGSPWNLDQYIALTLAYGHIGFLDWKDLHGILKIYNMVQPLQDVYVMVEVEKIEYGDSDGRLLTPSQALPGGAHRQKRVHVVYRNGFEVYVNGNEKPWQVRLGKRCFELPTWGYAAADRDGKTLAFSARVGASASDETTFGRRMDYCRGKDCVYIDSRGGPVSFEGVSVNGAAALRKARGQWWLIPATELHEFAFDPALAGFEPKRTIDVSAVREDGSKVGPAPAEPRSGLLHITPGASPAFKYLLHEHHGPERPGSE